MDKYFSVKFATEILNTLVILEHIDLFTPAMTLKAMISLGFKPWLIQNFIIWLVQPGATILFENRMKKVLYEGCTHVRIKWQRQKNTYSPARNVYWLIQVLSVRKIQSIMVIW